MQRIEQTQAEEYFKGRPARKLQNQLVIKDALSTRSGHNTKKQRQFTELRSKTKT